jgi:hypothetical protein
LPSPSPARENLATRLAARNTARETLARLRETVSASWERLIAADKAKEGRLLTAIRKELTTHVGGVPSATQAALIEQAAQIRLRLAVMDRKFSKSGEMSEHDSRTYLAWANSYARLLRQLGLKSAPEKPPTLASYLALQAASTGAHAA